MKLKETYQKGELAKQILGLCLVGGVVVTFVMFPGLTYVYKFFAPKNAYDRQRIYQSYKRLHNNGYLVTSKEKGCEVTRLTNKGRKQLLKYMVEDVLIKASKWDGVWRVVIFDIPEPKASIRREVSELLRNMGMFQLQKSVLITPYACKNQIDLLQKLFELQKDIVYMEVVHIENERKLKKHFKL